ncbi:hypothetical protein ACJMK2_015339 [Sinanodonta woodiana]|uniref:Uncharacterized protein n=1 Tax=Sinanodonta woodiana TaxID=1069815 RepID=A0ABD3UTN3_SINWO
MPQVYNKQQLLNQDSGVFGKNSRYMATIRLTEARVRRINVMNRLEQTLNKIHISYFEKCADMQRRKLENAEHRIKERLWKNIAYKYVLKRHSIAEASDYRKALNGNYSSGAMKQEITQMVDWMQPEKVRKRNAKALIEENRQRYQSIICDNINRANVMFPQKKQLPDIINNIPSNKNDNAANLDIESAVPSLPDIEKKMKPDKMFQMKDTMRGRMGFKLQAINKSFIVKQTSFVNLDYKRTNTQEELLMPKSPEKPFQQCETQNPKSTFSVSKNLVQVGT